MKIRSAFLLSVVFFLICLTCDFYLSSAESGIYGKLNYGLVIPKKPFAAGEGRRESYVVKLNKPKYFSVEVGSDFSNKIGFGLSLNSFGTINYKETEVKTGSDKYPFKTAGQEVKNNAVFANFYFYPELKTIENFKPYISAAFGCAEIKTNGFYYSITELDKSKNTEFTTTKYAYEAKRQRNVAWGVGFGVLYEINQNIGLELINYKFYDLGKFSTKGDRKGDKKSGKVKIHSLSAGVKFRF